MVTKDDIRSICLSLPEAFEQPYAGKPGFRVGKKLFARIRTDPEALVVFRPSVQEKEALIAAEPEIFFEIPHYEGYDSVLVNMAEIEIDELREVLTESWLLRAPAKLAAAFDKSQPRSTD